MKAKGNSGTIGPIEQMPDGRKRLQVTFNGDTTDFFAKPGQEPQIIEQAFAHFRQCFDRARA